MQKITVMTHDNMYLYYLCMRLYYLVAIIKPQKKLL
jgi:hypothetical protein